MNAPANDSLGYFDRWHESHDNVCVLIDYMAAVYPVSRESMEQIAYAVAKPWKHEDIYLAALAYNEEMDKDPLAEADGHYADDAERALAS